MVITLAMMLALGITLTIKGKVTPNAYDVWCDERPLDNARAYAEQMKTKRELKMIEAHYGTKW